MKKIRSLFKIKHLRLFVQIGLVLFLNFTIIGSLVISPLLPILRLDLPNVGGAGQHICTLGGVQRSITFFYPLIMLILILSAFILICTIFGRALCGWACPIGLSQDLLTHGRTAAKTGAKEMSEKTHVKMSLVKYAVLILTIIFAISIGLSVITGSITAAIYKEQFPGSLIEVAPYCQFCPTPILRHLLDFYIFEFNPQLNDPLSLVLFSMFFFFIIGAVAMPRFWCRYFCPMGAFSSFFNKFSLLSIQKEQAKCTKCNYCVSSCPTRVTRIRDESKDKKVTDMNCIYCLECIETCPEKALTLSMGKIKIYQGGKKGWWERPSYKP